MNDNRVGRWLKALLLAGAVCSLAGCRGTRKPKRPAATAPKPVVKAATKPSGEADAIARLKALGATIEDSMWGDYAVILRGEDITDDDLAALEHLPRVTWLDISQNKRITDEGLKHLKGLKKLETLYVYGTQVSDAGLVHLEGLPALEELSVLNTKVTREGIKRFQEAHPDVRCDDAVLLPKRKAGS